MKKLIVLLVGLAVALLVACGDDEEESSENSNTKASDSIYSDNSTDDTDTEDINSDEPTHETEEDDLDTDDIELTEQEETLENISDLFDEEKAFDTGTYSKGDIPEGEYAFLTFDGSGDYYSEEESNGNIVDNESFDSFGYVKVQEIGNVQTDGVLVDTDEFDDLDVSGAKELYEKLNDDEDYESSGWYKVGKDIDPGEYEIESHGEGYVAIMSGPVGDNEIVNNENFNGSYTVNVEEGQYLNVSSGKIEE